MGSLNIKCDPCFVRSDHGKNDLANIPASEVMGFQCVRGTEIQASFLRCDMAIDDQRYGNSSEPHGDELSHGDRGVGDLGAQPDVEELEENDDDKQGDKNDEPEEGELPRFCG